MLFWPFNFTKTLYYISCIYLYCYIGKNMQNSFLMGLMFWISWRVSPQKIKIFMEICIFKKRSKSIGFQVVVWSQNLRFSYFLFGFIFKRSLRPKRARSARRAAKPRARRAKRAVSGEAAKRQMRKPCTLQPLTNVHPSLQSFQHSHRVDPLLSGCEVK